MIQILDTLMIILFILFLVYIFRGYHLTRLDKERKEESNSSFDHEHSSEPYKSGENEKKD